MATWVPSRTYTSRKQRSHAQINRVNFVRNLETSPKIYSDQLNAESRKGNDKRVGHIYVICIALVPFTPQPYGGLKNRSLHFQ